MNANESTTEPADRGQLDHREEITLRAYYFWQQRGSPVGSPEVDWLRAEREVSGDGAGLADKSETAAIQAQAASA